MAGGNRKEYKMYIKIAGEIDKSLPESARLSKAELRAIAREASAASAATSTSFRKGLHESKSVFDETKPMFDKFSNAAKKATKVTVAAVTAASVALGTFSVKTGMAYESQMSTVRALSLRSYNCMDGERIRASDGVYGNGRMECETDGGCCPGNDGFGFGIRRGFGGSI